jgi:DNA polymerase III subunit gamma/tau
MSRRALQEQTEQPQTEPLHIKYRPKTLKDMRGQGAVIKSIEAAMKAKARPHAYLFTGEPGCGKTSLARILTHELHVTPNNIIEIDAASNGGIDVMRDVMAPLRYQGFGETPNKAVILDEAHMLSKQAWASLLKTVEEPPAHVYFFFCTTEASKVPQNIQTRCLSYDLKPLRHDDLLDLLEDVCDDEGIEVPSKIISMVANACNGSPRNALVMLAMVQTCDDPEDAARLLESPLDNKEVIDLCRALVRDELNWTRLTATLKAMPETQPESIRIIIVNYLNACLMGAKNDRDAVRLLSILDSFSKPMNPADKMGPIFLAFGDHLFG